MINYKEYLYFVIVNLFFYYCNCKDVSLWPGKVIPYTIDSSISSDSRQFYAVLAAKSILESNSCLKFVPRNGEYSYVKFSDLGESYPCWDIFDNNQGVVHVNVGPSCVQPFDGRKLHAFSDCDLKFVNNLYNCDLKDEEDNDENEDDDEFFANDDNSVDDCPPSQLINFHNYRRSPQQLHSKRRSLKKKNPWDSFYRTSTVPTRAKKFPKPKLKTQVVPTPRKPIAVKKNIDDLLPTSPLKNGNCSSACHYDGILTPLYQSYNDDILVRNHFYTEDKVEQSMMARENYLKQSNVGYIGQTPNDRTCTCLKPIYRLYNEAYRDTLLTTEKEERDRATTISGYRFERIIGYCTNEPGCGAYLPLYRLFNFISKDHFYTSDQDVLQYHRIHPTGYGLERIECFIWQYSVSVKGCDE